MRLAAGSISGSEAGAALGAAARNDGAACTGAHTLTETVNLVALAIIRLVRALHCSSPTGYGCGRAAPDGGIPVSRFPLTHVHT